MFYGIATEKIDLFKLALGTITGCFKKAFTADNMIILDHNSYFLNDEAFTSAFFAQATTEQEKTLIWRLHTLIWATKHCIKIPGDFVECGVFEGFCSSVITAYHNFNQLDKTFYLYDTFEGIPEGYNDSGHPLYDMSNQYQRIVTKFQAFPNVKIVKGVVPDSFQESCPDKIAFLHIDMNSAKSEISALEALYDRVSPNGIIVFDDFGWFAYNKQAPAEIEFMTQRGQFIMELPTGQGVMIKS